MGRNFDFFPKTPVRSLMSGVVDNRMEISVGTAWACIAQNTPKVGINSQGSHCESKSMAVGPGWEKPVPTSAIKIHNEELDKNVNFLTSSPPHLSISTLTLSHSFTTVHRLTHS